MLFVPFSLSLISTVAHNMYVICSRKSHLFIRVFFFFLTPLPIKQHDFNWFSPNLKSLPSVWSKLFFKHVILYFVYHPGGSKNQIKILSLREFVRAFPGRIYWREKTTPPDSVALFQDYKDVSRKIHTISACWSVMMGSVPIMFLMPLLLSILSYYYNPVSLDSQHGPKTSCFPVITEALRLSISETWTFMDWTANAFLVSPL